MEHATRAAFTLLFTCVCTFAAASAVGQSFPYTAAVDAQAPFYGQPQVGGLPAGQLPAGSRVEVYRHDGDWLAIRPPQGSFSWVSARDVEPTDQAGVVRARASGAICWIGHAGSEERTITQVTLNQGELLQTHGDSLVGDEDQVRQWYKIKPPAGEFRFIHKRHVNAGAGSAALPTASTDNAGSSKADMAADAHGWEARAVSPPAMRAAPSGIPSPTTTPAMPALPNAVMPASATATVQQRLAQIDQQLAAMLAYPPNRWNPGAVTPELQTLTATAPTAELREQARMLWAQAMRSEQVKQGYAQVAASFQAAVRPATANVASRASQPQSQVAPVSYYTATRSPYAQGASQARGPLHVSPEFQPLAPRNLLARVRQAAYTVTGAVQAGGTAATYGRIEERQNPTSAAGQPQVIASPVDENGYAGSGWLMPLVARSQLPRESRAGVPPLALTDDEGNVKFLVTPSAGISLREYLRKEVGIVGPVSKLPDIETPHITAQRAVILERHE